MLQIDPKLVRLGLTADHKEGAIRQAAAILAEAGCVDPAYAESMLGRERQVATYLGNGIAIPHGLRTDAGLIHQTAVSVAQFPEGVDWNGETVHLAVGIAAASDEHIQVLANLTDVLQDEAVARRLARTTDPQDIIRALTRGRDAAASAATAEDFPVARRVRVLGGAGLHARPATEFAGLAKDFAAEVRVTHGGKQANGKAMASLLTLGVETGAEIVISARGDDAQDAVDELAAAVAEGLGEEEEEDSGPQAESLIFEGDVRDGVAASPGVALGPLFLLRSTTVAVSDEAAAPDEEQARLQQALDEARAQLKRLHAKLSARSGSRRAAIILAHQELVDDPDLHEAAAARILQGASAARAWQAATEARAVDMQGLGNEMLAARAGDVRDVGRRVLRILAGQVEDEDGLELPDEPVILMAEDLAPSDTAGLDPERVKGVVTAKGGPNSHTAILARALALPAVVGLGEEVLALAAGTQVVVDGDGGRLVVRPSEADRRQAEGAAAARAERVAAAVKDAYRPAITRDGRRIEAVANIGRAEEAAAAVQAGAEGVGLLRTEFLFLERQSPPSEDEQFEALHRMTEALRGLPLIVRTLDIGGDKEVPYLRLPKEDNPFLGVRGIRLCLAQPELFRPQLRAIVRASKAAPPGAIKVMFPMVSTLEELRAGREALEAVRAELDGPTLEVGIMVEVPSAATMADVLAREADFFSIGTNDLTQYVLAMDRLHPSLTRQADGLHPAVLRMIAQVVEAAHAHGRWVGVCGNMAAEAAAAPILVGLGVDELSVSPPAVADLKALVRGVTMRRARRLARKALACGTAADVRALV